MRLACIAIPNFRIAMERARTPALIGLPVALGESPPGGNQIIDCSPEAASLGVRIGMPLRDARTLAPGLVLLPPDPVFYSRSFETMLAALEDTEPLVEPGELGIAFAATDPRADTRAQQQAAIRLTHSVRASINVMSRAGIGEGSFIAWLAASVHPADAARIVPAGSEQAFIAPLSTSFLPVSYDIHRKLALYGLHTIGDVAQLTVGAAQAQFGREGRLLWELIHGISTGQFRPRPRSEPVTGSLAMPAPTVNSAALIVAARQLVGRLLQNPAMRYRQVRQLRLRLLLLGGGSWERTLTFREPLGDDAGIIFVLKKLIEQLQIAAPVEEMSLEFIGLASETGKQHSLLFAEQARRRAQLLAALHQLKAQFHGESQVARVVEVEPWSRIPERRYALIDYDL
jgi:nucleotidyltransferase/DNA polymerase involved in DNA repair